MDTDQIRELDRIAGRKIIMEIYKRVGPRPVSFAVFPKFYRDMELKNYLDDGKSIAWIARKMKLPQCTIRRHRKRIYKSLK